MTDLRENPQIPHAPTAWDANAKAGAMAARKQAEAALCPGCLPPAGDACDQL